MSRYRNIRFQFPFQYPTFDWVDLGPRPFSVDGTKYYAVDDMMLTLMYEETT
jgi:1,2-phenylacetyl-CoA epoxidase catalytic subunit